MGKAAELFAAVTGAPVKQAEAKRDSLAARLASLEAKHAASQATVDAGHAAIREAVENDGDVDAATTAIIKAEADVRAASFEITALRAAVAAAREGVTAARRKVAEQDALRLEVETRAAIAADAKRFTALLRQLRDLLAADTGRGRAVNELRKAAGLDLIGDLYIDATAIVSALDREVTDANPKIGQSHTETFTLRIAA